MKIFFLNNFWDFQKEIINFQLDEYLKSISENGTDFEFYKIVVFPENVITNGISKNSKDENVFLGMHIDRSTIFQIETAADSKNRICINIGNEPRELYLINLSLLQIKDLLSSHSNQFINRDNIVEFFFNSEFINYPVIKIKINPFEYYIGPTDNYIHDGTTTNRKHPDITLTYLGKFVHND